MEEYGFNKIQAKEYIMKNRHNHVTTTYYLLLKCLIKSGTTSISDLTSNEYLEHIRNPKNILTNVNRTDYETTIENNKTETNVVFSQETIQSINNQDRRNADTIPEDSELESDSIVRERCDDRMETVRNELITEPNVMPTIESCQNSEYIHTTEYGNYFNADVDDGSKGLNTNMKIPFKPIFKKVGPNDRNVGNYIKSSLKDSLKEQYEKYVKKSIKYKIEASSNRFKKGFVDTSFSFDKKGDVRNKTYDNIRTDPDIRNEGVLGTDNSPIRKVPNLRIPKANKKGPIRLKL